MSAIYPEKEVSAVLVLKVRTQKAASLRRRAQIWDVLDVKSVIKCNKQ